MKRAFSVLGCCAGKGGAALRCLNAPETKRGRRVAIGSLKDSTSQGSTSRNLIGGLHIGNQVMFRTCWNPWEIEAPEVRKHDCTAMIPCKAQPKTSKLTSVRQRLTPAPGRKRKPYFVGDQLNTANRILNEVLSSPSPGQPPFFSTRGSECLFCDARGMGQNRGDPTFKSSTTTENTTNVS